jgi:hypothetical protein
MRAFLLLLALLALARSQHSMACGQYSCVNCDCLDRECPVSVEPGGHLAFSFNYSSFRPAFEVEGLAGPPADQLKVFYFTKNEYERYASGQPYTAIDGTPTPVAGWCNQPVLDTNGRGSVLVFECSNAGQNCSMWYSVQIFQILVTNCATDCLTGMVDNGVCNAACTVANCDYDGADCFVQRTSSTTRSSATPPATQAGTPPPPPPAACPISCTSSMRGDGDCDNQCNYAGCNFDDGDCEDPCTPNPCSNRGTCTPDSTTSRQTDYKCECPVGWCGAHCSTAEQLNNNGLKSQDYCVEAFRDCNDLYPDDSVYFCCEWLLTGADSTCRKADDDASSTLTALSMALLILTV